MTSKNKSSESVPGSWPEPVSSKNGSNRPMKNKLKLDKANGKLMGVCSGLANWSGMDANLLRIIFVLATIFGFGSAIIIYLAIGLIVD
jgi:phage shock protein C|tara:strand:- start:65374 stop:65637 length:264 start_codon:yes stop_codon:yes gene_type:complete